MERSSSLFASAVGVGLGVGLGLASARFAGSSSGGSGGGGGGATAAEMEAELRGLVVDGRESGVSFADFPYYISENLRLALTSAAFPYLNQTELPKHINVLSDTSRTILLCGPSEMCLHSLAKAVAHQFNARLLSLNIFEFSSQIQHKYGSTSNTQVPTGSTAESTLDRVYGWVESFNFFRKKAEPTGSLNHEKAILDLIPRKCYSKNTPSVWIQLPLSSDAKDRDSESMEDIEYVNRSWNLDEKMLIQSLYKIIVSVSEESPVILYIRDVNQFLAASDRAYSMFKKMLKKLSGRVLVIGSSFLNADQDSDDVEECVSDLFPYVLLTKPPKEKADLDKWTTQMQDDMKKKDTQEFTNCVTEVFLANNLECDGLSSVSPGDYETILNYAEEIMAPAVSYHLMNNKDPEYKNGRLVISSASLSHGLRIFQESNLGKDTVETKEESKQVVTDNAYEKRVRESVIPASETGVTFDDIGALDDIKDSIQELVMLPLQRPDFFNGGLLKPCRGILLFGPPGTGKTMLAKAIANETGASFMNISMSAITSAWYGEAEKYVRALFSLAAKIAPAIIFVDEVDSMLGTRDRTHESETSRRVKNEFMTHWDGLLSKSSERILVLAATNRPFDLDEAIIRRFEHRIMVGLPTAESRELILKKLLSKEKVENIDFKELAKITEGYSGSDLKNLCVTAAYRPVREILQKEKEQKKDNKKEKKEANKEQSGKEKSESSAGTSEKGNKGETEDTIALRPLSMEDLRQAKDQVAASLSSEGAAMQDIRQWNEIYGKGGSRKKPEQLTYFL
ncbi:hypothetical protein ACP4OV_027426 [Aristida adscensionis]